LLDALFVHDADFVGNRERIVLVVGHEDGRRVLLLEDVTHLQAQALAQIDVEVGEGLVHEQQLRARRQRTRQRDALLLAAGELVRIAIRRALHADGPEQLADARGARRRGEQAQARNRYCRRP
jgi:hypothetical protein